MKKKFTLPLVFLSVTDPSVTEPGYGTLTGEQDSLKPIPVRRLRQQRRRRL